LQPFYLDVNITVFHFGVIAMNFGVDVFAEPGDSHQEKEFEVKVELVLGKQEGVRQSGFIVRAGRVQCGTGN
jgi:hypothetical protein